MPHLLKPTPEQLIEAQTDITEPQSVEIQIRDDGKVIWVNVDGICVLRACRITNLQVMDYRETK